MKSRSFHYIPSWPRWSRRQCLVAFGLVVVDALAEGAGASSAFADEAVPDFRIVVHPSNRASSVSRRFLADAFLKDVTEWDGGDAIHPVDLPADSHTRSRFSETVVKRTVTAVKSYWQQRIFSGRGLPPPEVDSDDDVVRYVLKYSGAVGYVSGRADVGKVKVIPVHYD